MKQFGFFLGITLGVILILFGAVVIFQALPAALDVLEMPSRIPFVREIYDWLMSSASGLTAQLEQNFLEAFQTILKLILLMVFLWVCVQLVHMGVLILRAGVDLIRTSIEHGARTAENPTQPDNGMGQSNTPQGRDRYYQ
ncbi:hypothetical protein SAMN05880558_11918 [Aeromonas sp. RU39B]|jgi:hypothetical protein|uniref:hypothetical protein n=1 Tax=Aeromonas sp. RU39B TaxID=1907416 RepID=UPI0009544563|nr:hypothetical protein [Aeromonas sp. RU39B]SIR60504.1 hypothetical protein SAMN05880558_11918 [Aeromonas sp. RU39B]